MKRGITFLTRHYPPNPNINGESVWDMVKYLQETYNIESNVICIGRSSEGGGQRRESLGNVLRIKALYQGKNPALRMFTFLYDGYMLAKAALKYRDTFIVCTTSPPLLPAWASTLFSRNMKWALWAFDLFPEGFSVTGRIGSKHPVYNIMISRSYKLAPRLIIALGPRQAEHIRQKYNSPVPVTILPCGVFFHQEKSPETPSWFQPGKIHLGYCGNVGDPHNPDFIKAVIDKVDSSCFHLVLALYGRHAPALREYARGKEGISIVTSVPRSQLHFIDVHLVSLRKSWTHVAVPSKAVSAVTMGSAILFCGSRDSDNWFMFSEAGWYIDEELPFDEQIAKFLETLTPETLAEKKSHTSRLYEQLKSDVTSTYDHIAGIVLNPGAGYPEK